MSSMCNREDLVIDLHPLFTFSQKSVSFTDEALLISLFQVEEYMTDIIFKMRGDLREILRESVVDYPSKAREKWIFDWPSQIILVVNQIYWCQEVEEAFMKLNKGQSNAMKVHIPPFATCWWNHQCIHDLDLRFLICITFPQTPAYVGEILHAPHSSMYIVLWLTHKHYIMLDTESHCCRSTTSSR